jgi:hypothetical protein
MKAEKELYHIFGTGVVLPASLLTRLLQKKRSKKVVSSGSTLVLRRNTIREQEDDLSPPLL